MHKIEHHLDEIRETLNPDSFRYKTLQSAANFKAGWADLAEKLTEVFRENLFQEWGYNTFEQYCRLEIRITKKTASKLTGAWEFFREEAKELSQPPPDLKTVEMLQKAKNSDILDPEKYDALKLSVLKNNPDGKEISRQFKEFNKLLGNVSEQTDKTTAETLTLRLRKKLVKLAAPEYLLEFMDQIEMYLKHNSDDPENGLDRE